MNVGQFIGALLEAGVTHVVGLPDTETAPVFDRLAAGGPPRLVSVCREGEALAVAAGLWGGGMRPVVLIQSTGFFESGDALRNLGFELEVPLDLIVGYRGSSGKLNAGQPDTAARFLEPVLRAWSVPYEVLEDPSETLAAALRRHGQRERGLRAILLPQ